MAAQRDVVATPSCDIYMEGDPDLMAFSSLLESDSAEDLTRRAEVSHAMVDSSPATTTGCRRPRCCSRCSENQVKEARDEVAVKREEAADNLAVKEQLEGEAETAKASVVALVGERASARAEAGKVRARDVRKLKQPEREKARIEERLRRIAAAALRRARAKAAAQARGVPTNGTC